MLVHPILVTRDLTVLFHKSMGVTLASVPVATSDLSVTLTSTNAMRVSKIILIYILLAQLSFNIIFLARLTFNHFRHVFWTMDSTIIT